MNPWMPSKDNWWIIAWCIFCLWFITYLLPNIPPPPTGWRNVYVKTSSLIQVGACERYQGIDSRGRRSCA